jgi:transcriptional regulator with XRE-family HTH domain
MRIGKVLRALRRNRKLPQKTIAKGLGISAKEISLHESGKRRTTTNHVAGYVQQMSLSEDEWLEVFEALLADMLEGLRPMTRVSRPLIASKELEFNVPLQADMQLSCSIRIQKG